MNHKGTMLAVVILLALGAADADARGEKRYHPKWHHAHNKIIDSSVCYNYPYGSLDYRGCRRQAQQHFIEQCRFYSEKVRRTVWPYSKEFLPRKQMFCHAAGAFNPIN